MKPKATPSVSTPTKKSPINYSSPDHFTVEIEGESCFPKLIAGKKYLANKTKKPELGDFIVFKNPQNQNETFAKQVHKIESGGYFVKAPSPGELHPLKLD